MTQIAVLLVSSNPTPEAPMNRKQRRALAAMNGETTSLLPRWHNHTRVLLEPLDNGGGGTVAEPETETVETDAEPADGGTPEGDRPDFNAPNASDPFAPPANPAQRQTPADPNNRGVQPRQPQTPTGQQQTEWQSIQAAATALGYNAGGQQFADDRQFLVHLLQQAGANRQADVYAQLGRQLAPQADQIRTYLQQQQTPAAPTQRPAWEAPEFDERWASLVTQDPATGVYIGKQGVPAEITQKVNAYVEWKKNYDRNPAAVINGMVESRAKEVAAQTFREQFATVERDRTIQSIVAGNQTWMYQADESGVRVTNPVTGQPQLTPVGVAYVRALQEVRNYGVTDPSRQDALAKKMVRADYALAAQQAASGQQQQVANPQTQQQQFRPNRNVANAAQNATRRRNPAATEDDGAGLGLQEMLKAAMAAEGVTDQDITDSLGV